MTGESGLMSDIADMVREAGVVGAGGAGFPTHVKIAAKAECVIANGAECEPLLRVDQQVMAGYPDDLVEGLLLVMRRVNASQGYIALKDHYRDAIAALEEKTKAMNNVSLFVMRGYYPAGDEQQLVYEITGRVVPTGGIPLDVGAVVSNVSTLVNVARANGGTPVTEKLVTVGGAVAAPVTLNAPIGTPLGKLIEEAGGATEPCGYIEGGPCMGKEVADLDQPVTKTTGGVLAIPSGHALMRVRNREVNMQMVKAVCCQCTMCSQICPRNALGLRVEPHKAMRSLVHGTDLIGDINGVFSCCDCGICTYYACNFGLNPALVMANLKSGLAAKGVNPVQRVFGRPDESIGTKRLPTSRIMRRLGVNEYDVPAPIDMRGIDVDRVLIPLKMHIGAPAIPVVKDGRKVGKGDLIAEIPDGALGARVHASIDGTVSSVTDNAIGIERQ
jgi:Na+-translocating ferredoxin:NAD+ oxidoreductase RnfC subunit